MSRAIDSLKYTESSIYIREDKLLYCNQISNMKNTKSPQNWKLGNIQKPGFTSERIATSLRVVHIRSPAMEHDFQVAEFGV